MHLNTFFLYAPYCLNMESVTALVYCDGDMIISYEGIVFECPSDPKVITISDNMSLDYIIWRLQNFTWSFYCQPIYVGDGCVEYDYMELKRDNDVGKMFFVYLEFSTKGLIESRNISTRLKLNVDGCCKFKRQ